MFGPDNTVNGFGGRITDRTAGILFLTRFRLAFVALALAFEDDHDLAQIASCAALNQRYVGRQAHTVHVIPGGWKVAEKTWS